MIGFAGAHGDALELFEFAEEVFDEVPPLVHVLIDAERRHALRTLGDDDLGASFVELIDDPVSVERLVGKQGIELEIVDQRGNADGVVTLAG